MAKTLELEARYISVEFGHLDTRRAKKIVKDGITDEALEELLRGSEGGPTEGVISCDGKEVFSFVYNDLAYESKRDHFKEGKWLILKTESGRATYNCELKVRKIEPDKFEASRQVELFNGETVSYVSLEYDGNELEMELDIGIPKYESVALIAPDGVSHDFEIIEE